MKFPLVILALLSLFLSLVLGGFIGSYLRVGEPSTFTTYLTETETIYVTVTHIVTLGSSTRESGCIVFSTTKDVFKVSEPVEFILINNCEDSIVLSNSAPWRIEGLEGEVVFKPISLQVLVEVKLGEEMKWIWDQRDSEGKQVPTGRYYVVIDTFNKGSFRYGFWIG